MIIIEGSDLVGKTTFCQKLVKALEGGGYTYNHLSRLPPGWHYYWSYVDKIRARAVQDRFHDSDLAYCHARGETSKLENVDLYRLVEAKLSLVGCVKVVILAENAVLKSRFEDMGDDMYDVDVILKANQWFKENMYRFDLVFSGFPDEYAIAEVMKLYVKRQSFISHLKYEKPKDGL